MTKISELNLNDPVHGTVKSISVAGAFIDVGAEVEGFVHISQLSSRKINRVEDVLEVGKDVELWVRQIDPDAQKLELTLIRPVGLKWGQIKPGLRVTGMVTRLEKFGAFVDIGAEREGLVHVSEMSDDYVRDPADVTKVGNEVEVTVLEVDRAKRQVRLSMKVPAQELYEEEEEEEEELPSAMELALREAMEGAPESSIQSPGQDQTKNEEGRKAQADLLTRTLLDRVPTSASDPEGD